MDYWHALTISASTPVSAPYRETMGLCPGIIQEIMLFFPSGQRGTARCRILHQEHQQWPTNLEGWYLGDDTVIEFPEHYPMAEAPYELVLEGYNTDTEDEHTVYVRVTVLEEVRPAMPTPPAPTVEHPF